MDNKPRPGDLYRHFTNKIYQVITTAVHSETGEDLVIYQAMSGKFEIYASPSALFVREAGTGRSLQAPQRCCFEKIGHTGGTAVQEPETAENNAAEYGTFQKEMQQEEKDRGQEAPAQPRPRTQSPADAKRVQRQFQTEASVRESGDSQRRRRQMEEREQRREQFRRKEKHVSATEELRANPSLLKFLDADTYAERFQVLNEIQDDMTDRLIDDIAVVLDVVIPEGPLSSRYHQLRNIIMTRQKYESSRLRR